MTKIKPITCEAMSDVMISQPETFNFKHRRFIPIPADTMLSFFKDKKKTAVKLHKISFRKASLAGGRGTLVRAAHSLTGPLPALIMQPLWRSMAPSRRCVALQGPFVKQRSRKWDWVAAVSLSPQPFLGGVGDSHFSWQLDGVMSLPATRGGWWLKENIYSVFRIFFSRF